MDSIIALFQGMGIMHMEWGQAVMIIVSLVLLWLAIARALNHFCSYRLVLGDYSRTFLKREWR